MKIFGLKINFTREPRRPPLRQVIYDIVVLVEGFEGRLRELEKKAEATRRKVYRDEDAEVEKVLGEKDSPAGNPIHELANLPPGSVVDLDKLLR